MLSSALLRILTTLLTIAAVLRMGGCRSLSIDATSQPVIADDGATLMAFELKMHGRETRTPRGWLFYVQGSEPRTVTDRIGQLAGASAMGLSVVIVERRGVRPDRPADEAMFHASSAKPRRVQDELAVIRHFLRDAPPGTPVVLMGESEGGEVAAAVARQEPRVTHLILLGCGGGWAQAREFEHFVATQGAYLDVTSTAQLQARFDDIRANPDAMTMWAGHPYRRWSSYLWSAAGDDLLTLDTPIFLAQGGADTAVPVESTRALADAFAAAGKSNLRYVEYAGVDHSMHEVAAGRSILPLLEIDILRWLCDGGVIDAGEFASAERRVRAAHPEWFGTDRSN